jgi:SAM-dependent methyltransferase
MASSGKDGPSEYTLGHSGDELKRLNAQANLVGPFTRRFFEEAGICAGMRVLDVGCGAGDVSLLARELVGDAGEVIGFDLSEEGVAAAGSRAASLGFQNVSFNVGDPCRAAFDRPFDAVIGRYVLMFQRDPAAMLRQLTTHVRSGGIVVFHEPDCDDARSLPPVETYDLCWRWVISAIGNADTSLGTKLPAIFLDAGLPAPAMRLEALIGGGTESGKPIELVAGLVETLLPEIERLGIATAASIDVATLAARMHEETIQKNSVLIGRSEIGAWCRV